MWHIQGYVKAWVSVTVTKGQAYACPYGLLIYMVER